MHMLMMTVIGLALLAAFVFGAHALNRAGTRINGPLVFIGFWLAVSAVSFLIGVFVAGYSVLTELGVHAVIFGVPAGLAWFLSRRAAAGIP
jgi:hypothetical protein